MANWYGAARSNYVKIKDMDGLQKALEPFPINISEGDEGKVCFLSEDEDSGGWPTFASEDEGEEVCFDAESCICPFMGDNQILVMMEAGAEKLRYITGNAAAYNAKGDVCSISLQSIYVKAAVQFSVPIESITRAEY